MDESITSKGIKTIINVMNVTVPKITIEDLEKEYEIIIEGQQNLEVIGGE